MKKYRADGSFVIEKNGYPFHVTAEMPEYAEVLAEFQNNQQDFVEDTPPEIPEFVPDYKYLRLLEYPEPGDFIDAFCKAQTGDDTELKALMARRDEIKRKYPK